MPLHPTILTRLLPSYVLLAASLFPILNAYHANATSAARSKAKIPYPNSYATAEQASSSRAAYIFNCAQRAHTNYLEHQTTLLAAMFVAGLKAPAVSAAMGVAWLLARMMYLNGYVSDSPENQNGKGRLRGIWHFAPYYGLVGMGIWGGISSVQGLLPFW